MRKLALLMLVMLLTVSTTVINAQDDMAFDCGTDEEVTINYFGDPVGSHPEAEQATIGKFARILPLNSTRVLPV